LLDRSETFSGDFATKIVYLHVLSFGRRRVISQITMNAAFADPAAKKNHPKVGAISFGLAIGTGVITFLLFVASLIPASNTYMAERFSAALMIFGLGVAPVLHLAGLILGVIGAFTKNSKKVFPILGIIFNLLPLIIAAILLVLFFVIIWAVISSGGGWR
jgi:hypothetical protein